MLGMLRVLKHMPAALRKHASRPLDYSTASPALGGTVGIHDPALNLFLRATLEHGYQTVIEIGAYSGARILTLKRLVPAIDAWALDIIPPYAVPSERDGVRFERYDLSFFDRPLARALVCSRGTLSMMPPDQVEALMHRLAERGFDLALCEPVAYRSVPHPLRRAAGSYYYPYEHMFRHVGMAPQSTFEDATRFGFNLSMMEAWYVTLARVSR
ncbi:MAG: hypothetical protein AB7G15_18760 [Alphaproteobacteria bacterium]